jgi:hypothetical protein
MVPTATHVSFLDDFIIVSGLSCAIEISRCDMLHPNPNTEPSLTEEVGGKTDCTRMLIAPIPVVSNGENITCRIPSFVKKSDGDNHDEEKGSSLLFRELPKRLIEGYDSSIDVPLHHVQSPVVL